jgi:hypothetical protein
MSAPRIAERMPLIIIVMKYFEYPRLGQSQFSYDILRASPWISFHSSDYGFFIGWCPYGSVGDRHSRVPCVLHYCLTETLLQSSKHSGRMTLTWITWRVFRAVVPAGLLTGADGQGHVAVLVAWRFHDHWIVTVHRVSCVYLTTRFSS